MFKLFFYAYSMFHTVRPTRREVTVFALIIATIVYLPALAAVAV